MSEVIETFEAEAAFGAELALIKGTSGRQVKLPAAANEQAVGISGLAGDPAGTGVDAQKKKPPVIVFGRARATAGAAIAIFERVKILDATGKLTPIGGEAGGSTVQVVGTAVQAAAADGDTFDMIVNPYEFTA